MDQALNSTEPIVGVEFVRGLQGLSDETSTVWVQGDLWPRYEEVVTRVPICASTKLVIFVEQMNGCPSLSIGLIFPNERNSQCLWEKSGEHPRLTGKLWAWSSHSGQIYNKMFDSKNNYCRSANVMKHVCSINTASKLRVHRDVKSKTVHFSISGKEQVVSCSDSALSVCYGFVRLNCGDNSSRIQVKLALEIQDEAPLEQSSSSVEVFPKEKRQQTCWLISLGRKINEEFAWLLPVKPKEALPCQDGQEVTESQELSPYPFRNKCRGICLVINNVEDSNLEESKLTDLFSFLEFDVEVRRRHAMIQICEVAQEFSRKDHSAFDSFVFIVMSQTEFGSGEHIVGVDGRKVTIEQVMSDYKASSCRSLKGKPKLFFVLRFTKPLSTQLVESHDSGFGARVCTDSAKVLVQTCNTAGHDVCPEEADFMLACATSPTLGGRKRSECSFIRVMAETIRECHLNYHLLEMLTKVNERTVDLNRESRQSNTMPYLTHTLRHKVHFASAPNTTQDITQATIPDPSKLSSYEFNKQRRGYCVIINNVRFREKGTRDREGSLEDERRLKAVFKKLRFNVVIKKDLDKHQIERVAQDYATKNHEGFGAFVLILMSHGGDRDCISGVDDRETTVQSLMMEFRATKCPSLKGKPKIFIFQTCRGPRIKDAERFDRPTGGINAHPSEFVPSDPAANQACACPFPADSTLPKSVFPPEADFLLAFATVPGFVAFRSEQTGSFFIQALVEVIQNLHHRHHLLDMLTEVTRRVIDHQNRTFEDRDRVQVPAPTHTLTKLLYL